MLKLLFVVRTFGPAGGMERYVFETAREMAIRGHDVSVLCRAVHAQAAAQTTVKTVVLQPKPAKRGWEDRENFAEAVSGFLGKNSKTASFDVIHSHENTLKQDVSTEHGPCTLAGLRRAPWKVFDYSALRNLILERVKFNSRSLSALVSCSAQVEKTVLNAYPHLRAKIRAVISPAYSYLASGDVKVSGGFTLGFIGADWKRKGLLKALEIFTILRRWDPRWTMVVAGVEPSCLPNKLFSRLPDGVSLAGRVDPTKFFTTIDLLLHPAREEPFGMVIAESLSQGVPAVISERCGCAEHLQADGLKIVEHDKSADDWASACLEMHWEQAELISQRTWTDVAVDHECLYDRILSARQARVA
jgi:UDP-glucose:(heptosyl)LPS alpha-1,3-glucosyltransferase